MFFHNIASNNIKYDAMENQKFLIQITKPELQTIVNEIVTEVLENQPEPKSPENDLITRNDAAKLIGVTLPTLHTYTRRGLIPTYKIGRNVRFKKSEIIESLNKVETLKYRRV